MKSSFLTAPGISKPLLKCSILKCISWLSASFFGGEHRGFLKKGVKTYRMAPMSPLNSPTFFVCYSLRFCLRSPGKASKSEELKFLDIKQRFSDAERVLCRYQVLSGSGVFDGSEIHEASAILVHLTRAGAVPAIYAPDITQSHVVDHSKVTSPSGEFSFAFFSRSDLVTRAHTL